MEYWTSLLIPSGLALIGWVINTLITKKIDALEAGRKEDRELLFRRLDEVKTTGDTIFVRKDTYDQQTVFQREITENKSAGMLAVINSQFTNMDNRLSHMTDRMNEKITSIRELDTKIDEIALILKTHMNEKK